MREGAVRCLTSSWFAKAGAAALPACPRCSWSIYARGSTRGRRATSGTARDVEGELAVELAARWPRAAAGWCRAGMVDGLSPVGGGGGEGVQYGV